MITLNGISHSIEHRGAIQTLLQDADFDFNLRRMGLLAPHDKQAETLIGLLAGHMLPQGGSVRRAGRISWPIGRLVQFRSELSGRDTVRFLSQLYGLRMQLTEEFLHDMVGFGEHYDKPVSNWPRLLNIKFGHAAALLPNFDIYLVEGPLVISDPAFMELWLPEFEARLKHAQLIMSCSQMPYLAQFCHTVAVLQDGQLARYPDVASAFQAVSWAPAENDEPSPRSGASVEKDEWF